MKRLFGIACLGSIVTAGLPISVNAQGLPGYLCGAELRISFSPCGSVGRALLPQELNRMFLERYKSIALAKDPILFNEIQHSKMQQVAIKTSQAYCDALRADLSDRAALRKAAQKYWEARSGMQQLLDSTHRNAVTISVGLAQQYYCPDL